jgi:4'-phosphopantetheinyl transferase
MSAPDIPTPYQLVLSRGLPDEAGAARLRRDLPEEEWRWITRLRRPDDRLRSLVGRALVRRLLGRRLDLAPEEVPLGAGPRGKPVLRSGGPGGGAPASSARQPPAWHFNIAHSGDLVLAGIGPRPLGVDVEHCPDSVDANLWRLVAGGPPPDPVPGASATAPDPQAFCAQWVRREAVLKACGLGLAAEPGALRLADAQEADWTPVSGLPEAEGLWVRLLWASPEHCAALCLPGMAPAMPSASARGPAPHDAPSPGAWTLRTLALADWADEQS